MLANHLALLFCRESSPEAIRALVQPLNSLGVYPPDILPAGGAELVFDQHRLKAEHHVFFEFLRIAWRERRQVVGGAADAMAAEIQVLLIAGVAGDLDADFSKLA